MSNNEEKDYNLISNILPGGVIIFAIVIILGMVLIKKPELEYKISGTELLAKLLERNELITPDVITDILQKKDSTYRLIDLRSTPDYLKGHLEGAINIPIYHILDKKYKAILDQDKKTNILYYSDHCGACGPWMILSQLGYKNNKILMGGYDYVKEYILQNNNPLSGNYQNEKALYDYAKVISETSGGQNKMTPANMEKTLQPPVVKKKKKEQGQSGGC